MTKKEQSEQNEARETLRKELKPGMTVYCNLRSVSRSGMSRVISLHYIDPAGELRWISWLAAKACGDSYDRKREGVKISGCGMDMGFALVSNLAAVLFPDGFDCIGENCPAADHSNYGRSGIDQPPAGTCRDHLERTAGVCTDQNCKPWHHSKFQGAYALRHRWI